MEPSQFEVEIISPGGATIGVVRRPPPPPRRVWLHVLLLVLTFASATIHEGALSSDVTTKFTPIARLLPLFHPALLYELGAQPAFWRAGLSFSIPLILILFAHEMGHYIACRKHRLNATLPFFLPVPFGIGTLGAFIRIRTPLATKRELFDVGASGPIAGFIMAIPTLIVGLALSQTTTGAPKPGAELLGDPLALQLVTRLTLGPLPPNGDVSLHAVAFAAWFGLLVTALNLLPFGQLDGGHVVYAMFGRWQRRVAWPLLAVLLLLGLKWPGWLLWVVIAIAMGVRHPWIPDEDGSLDGRRRLLGWICIIIFIICFTPQPFKFVP